MKKIISISMCMLFLLVMLTACGQNRFTKSGETSSDESKLTIKVGTWKTAQTLQPYFYNENIDNTYKVEVLPFANPGDQKMALLSGSIDLCGTTLVTAIIAADNHEPVKIVTSLCNKCSALVVGKNSNIKCEADLKGKTIAYVPGTMHHILLLEVLKRNGIDPNKDVTLKRIDFFDMGQALKDGTIDAFCSGEPYPSDAIEAGYGEILDYPYFDDSIGTINGAMITTEDMIKNHREKVQAAVTAHVESTKYLKENNVAWIEKCVDFGVERKSLEVSLNNIELGSNIDDDYIKHTKKLAEKMLELSIIKEMPDIDSLFDTSFLEVAKKGK